MEKQFRSERLNINLHTVFGIEVGHTARAVLVAVCKVSSSLASPHGLVPPSADMLALCHAHFLICKLCAMAIH
jgi:hypothetical protein